MKLINIYKIEIAIGYIRGWYSLGNLAINDDLYCFIFPNYIPSVFGTGSDLFNNDYYTADIRL